MESSSFVMFGNEDFKFSSTPRVIPELGQCGWAFSASQSHTRALLESSDPAKPSNNVWKVANRSLLSTRRLYSYVSFGRWFLVEDSEEDSTFMAARTLLARGLVGGDMTRGGSDAVVAVQL